MGALVFSGVLTVVGDDSFDFFPGLPGSTSLLCWDGP